MPVEEKIVHLPLDKIAPSFGNDRTLFDENALDELAESIRLNGLAQPITVRPLGEDRYQLIAGERRYRAHCLLASYYAGYAAHRGVNHPDHVDSVKAIVTTLTDEFAAAVMLAENTGRRDLDPIDEAQAYNRRIRDFGWDKKTVADKAGVSSVVVSNRLKLLNLRSDLQFLVRTGALQVGYAQIIADAEIDKNRQMIVFQRLQQNPAPTMAWLRRECAELATQQAQTDMFGSLPDSAFEASIKIEPVTVKLPPDPRTDKAPMKGRTYIELITNQVEFWKEAAEKWDRYGKAQQRDRCLAAMKALTDILSVMPDHGNQGKKVKAKDKTYIVYESA